MTKLELETALRKKSSDEFKKFVCEFGGTYTTTDTIIRDYINHPEWEPRLCQLLGFLTEDERKTQAVLQSATAAKKAATAAILSAIAAAVSAFIAFFSLLFKCWSK